MGQLFLTVGVFQNVNEKYEANRKDLLPYRTATEDDQATTSSPPIRRDSLLRSAINPLPNIPNIEYYENGLDNIVQISKDWETFKESHEKLICEKLSETEFSV